MKKILALFIAIILSAILFGCVGNSDSDGTRIYADGITFNMIGYTQEESEKYIENIPTEDGGILKIYHLKDDSGRICSKLLISPASTSVSGYDSDFDKKGRVIKEIDISYINPETMNYREYGYSLLSSKVDISLIYICGTHRTENSLTHKMQAKDNTVTAIANYEGNNLESVIITEFDKLGNSFQFTYINGELTDN